MINHIVLKSLNELADLSRKIDDRNTDKVDISRKIIALIQKLPDEGVRLGALVSLCLWDPSARLCRFTCDSLANSSHPWAAKVFASRGITDHSAAWQIKRRDQLNKLNLETPRSVSSTLKVLLQEKAFVAGSQSFSYSDDSLCDLITTALSNSSSAGFSFGETIIEIATSSPISNRQASFLTKLGLVTQFLPISSIVVSESPKQLDNIFDIPSAPFWKIDWFIRDDTRTYTYLGRINSKQIGLIPNHSLTRLEYQEILTLPSRIRFQQLSALLNDISIESELRDHFSSIVYQLSGEPDWSNQIDAIGSQIHR